MSKTFAIAIDGPVASGKGTLAARLAKKLNAVYIYTGAMYRALALACLWKKVNIRGERSVFDLLLSIAIELKEPVKDSKETFLICLNGKDITDEIHAKEVEDAVPVIAAYASVREQMVKEQQEMARGKNVVMEGRDIATKVIPNADLKIFLTAGIEERARRRYAQFQERGDERPLSEIIEDIRIRDKQDSQRGASPLMVGKDTVVLDTTSLSIEKTVDAILDLARKKKII